VKKLIIALVCLAVAGFLYASWKIKRDVAKGVDAAVVSMSPYAVVQYDGVSATLTGELTVNGIRARVKGFTDEIYIDRIGIDTPSFLSLMKLGNMEKLARSGDNFLPKYFGIVVEGFKMPVDADYVSEAHAARLEQLGVEDASDPGIECTGKYGLSPAALLAMGYKEYDLSMSAGLRQRDNDYAVEITSSGTDMWSLDAELILVGDMFTEMSKGSRYRPKMSEMRIEYTDQSRNERMVDYCKRLGLSDDEVQTAMLDSFDFLGKDNGVEFNKDIKEQFAEFLGGRETFILTAKPREPLNLSQISLYNPKDVPALLLLEAEAL
jgi:hypothetical protein